MIFETLDEMAINLAFSIFSIVDDIRRNVLVAS